MADKKQQLVLAILDFFDGSIKDGTVREDDVEGLDVAMQCIGAAFNVDANDAEQRKRLNIEPASLVSIFDDFLSRTRNPISTSQDRESAKRMAETHKSRGNKCMSSKQYDEAIVAYSAAIALDATNPVYYSNRAAAYTNKGDHSSASSDARKAIEVDPTFIKAYSRLGHAEFMLGNHLDAKSAFEKGLELDPSNEILKSGLKSACDRLPADEYEDEDKSSAEPVASTAGIADMLRNMGGSGAGGGGGMPDIASMMKNPMMMQMAQKMMENGGLEKLMENPSVMNMMDRVKSGGGLPSMSDLMSDPTLRDLAQSFGGGARPPPAP